MQPDIIRLALGELAGLLEQERPGQGIMAPAPAGEMVEDGGDGDDALLASSRLACHYITR